MGITTFLAILSIMLTLLSGGLGTFLVRYGTRLTVVEGKVSELTALNVSGRLAAVEEAVKEIKNSIAPVQELPVMSQKLDSILSTLGSMIPRTEADLRFQIQDQKIESLRDKVETH